MTYDFSLNFATCCKFALQKRLMAMLYLRSCIRMCRRSSISAISVLGNQGDGQVKQEL